MKSLAFRFLTAFASYLAGERLVAATFPQGMDYGRKFWDVVLDTFNFEYYPFSRVAVVAGISGLLVLADRVGPKRIPLVWLAVIAAFSGGYYYAVVFSLDSLENSAGGYLYAVMPQTIVTVFVLAMHLLAMFFPFILLAAIKLAGFPKIRARLTFGG